MDPTTVVPIVLAIGVPLFFAFVIGIILFVGKARPVPGLGVRLSATDQRPVGGSWNGEVLGEGGLGSIGSTLASTFGTFRIESGTLFFTPDDGPGPLWSVPCPQLVVRRRGLISMDGSDLELWGPMGHLRCNVSRERINRISRNDIKDLRERRYAEEFAWTLGAHGARVAP